MSTSKFSPDSSALLTDEFMRLLGVRRSMRLRRIMRQTNLPPEVLIDLALELLDIASRKLSPSPIQRQAVGLGAARWRNVSPEERSKALRRAAQARWAKPRASKRATGGNREDK
jgi:hypothetical protein